MAYAAENKLVVHADQGEHEISQFIYGHFAEHLGRCIYEGIWVGEDSPIPNTRGIRNDVVKALKRIKVLRSITGWMVSDLGKNVPR
jgi:alpha-N-arabinofuranosidase